MMPQPLSSDYQASSFLAEEEIDACEKIFKRHTDHIAVDPPSWFLGDDLDRLLRRVKAASAAARARLREALGNRFPGISWIDGESRVSALRAASGTPAWLYVPIDGAHHCVQGLPFWSASLALVQDGRTLVSFVYAPSLNEMFAAVSGCGATLNGRPIIPSRKQALDTAVVATTVPAGPRLRCARNIALISGKVFAVHQFGSPSLQLAYVGAGRLDACWQYANSAEDWTAGSLIAEEAGAIASHFDLGNNSGEQTGRLAAAPRLWQGLHALLAGTQT